MSAVEAEKKAAEETKVEEKGGELLFCGATCWNVVGRKKGAPCLSSAQVGFQRS